MSSDFESPFLDRDTPLSDDEDPAGSSYELESPFDQAFAETESPFVNAEAEAEAPFLPGEAESAGDPSLFSLGELESEEEAGVWETTPVESEEWEWEQEESWGAESEANAEDGEITYVGEELGDGSEGEFTWEDGGNADQEVTPAPGRIQARILWPALGFPAMIAPRSGSREAASLRIDATRCVTVLLLCDRPALSKAEAARYLRILPWEERGRRHIKPGTPGSFREEDLVVRIDGKNSKLRVTSAPASTDNEVIAFGGDDNSHAVVVTLPKYVRDIYAKAGMKYLHEIRLSEEASARLDRDCYHVFWNNHGTEENAPSDELAMLLQSVAKSNREKDGKLWPTVVPEPLKAEERKKWAALMPRWLKEYEYEYGGLSEPYKARDKRSERRAEILHPVFVTKAVPRPLKIAHVTDLHVDVRWDVFEKNLTAKAPGSVQFNNCNRSVAEIYEDARNAAHVILMTGDLIDYGRGHAGLDAAGKLGENRYYLRDRNWFLFYDVLASGQRYKQPVYTCLGNHDWRLNPYPPFAPGAPNPEEIFHNFRDYSQDQLKDLVQRAHGTGHEARFSYDPKWKHVDLKDVTTVLGKAAVSSETIENAGLPTETHIDSIAWYLLSINPFLDYRCMLPGGYRLLMLDFAKRESVLADDTRLGKNYGWLSPGDARSRGPRALSCLTKTQQWMVKQFTELSGKAKMIGMHVPPIGPYPDWSEADLIRGFKTYKKPLEARGPLSYTFQPSEGGAPLKGHPLFAIRPDGADYGMDAEYGSFRTARSAFIKEVAKPSAGVQLLFTGHIHRNGLLAVHVPGPSAAAKLKGQYLVKSVARTPSAKAGTAHAPQTLLGKDVDPRRITDGRAPLYVNTTSAGPLGNFGASEGGTQVVAPGYTYVELTPAGVIEKVSFRFPVKPRPIGQTTTAGKATAKTP